MQKIFTEKLTGKTAIINAKVEVNADKLIDIIQCAVYNATRHVMQVVSNKIVGRTLPNNPSSGNNPRKAAVNNLRRRIRRNFLGDGKDFLTAPVAPDGKPVWSMAEGASSMPVVVVKKWRGRPSKNRPACRPDRVYTPNELVQYIKQNTVVQPVKGSTAMRVMNDGVKAVWAEKSTLQQVSKKFEQRAGNNIYGWASLAEEVGSAAMQKSLNLNAGSFDGKGVAAVKPSTYSRTHDIEIQAYNPNAPKGTEGYQQRVIDRNIPKWLERAYKTDVKYLGKKLTSGIELPPDTAIRWE